MNSPMEAPSTCSRPLGGGGALAGSRGGSTQGPRVTHTGREQEQQQAPVACGPARGGETARSQAHSGGDARPWDDES